MEYHAAGAAPLNSFFVPKCLLCLLIFGLSRLLPLYRMAFVMCLGRLRNLLVAAVVAAEFDCPEAYCFDPVGLGFAGFADFGAVVLFQHMTFGEKLYKLRKSQGLSQEALAEKLNTSRQAVSKWENNNGYPETEKIILISKIFQVKYFVRTGKTL